MRNRLCLFVALFAVLLSSCNYQRKLQEQLYFNDALDSTQRMLSRYSATIKVDDRISIQVSALNTESAIPYNLSIAVAGIAGTTGYLVERDGTILYPQFGKLLVEGKTLTEVRSMLLDSLAKFLVDPMVTVQYANAKILVMGEVGRPGIIQIPDGKLTLLEAITMSGDIPYTGRKDNILIVREDNGQRDFARIDIRSHNIYKSPYYFLRQNDLIFVEPTLQKIRQQSNQTLLTNVSLVTSIVSVISTSLALFIYLKAVK